MKAAEQKAGQVGLGRAVTHLHEQAALTQGELPKRADLSQAELEEIERGDVDPTWGELRRITYALNVELDNLLELSIEMAPGPAGDRLRQQEQESRDLPGRAADEDEGDGDVTGDDEYDDNAPVNIDPAVVWGIIADSPLEKRRLRLLNAAGDEIVRVSGRLAGPAWVAEKGEGFAELLVSSGGLSAKVRVPLDPETRCTIDPDGTMIGVLPSGASWITTPLDIEGREEGKQG